MEERVNWFIIPVNVTKANEVIAIDKKLPPHLIKCVGVLLSIKTYLDTGIPIINHIGHLTSLSFNGRKDIPFAHHIGYNKTKPISKARKFEYTIEDSINDNCQVYALYKDSGTALDDKNIFIPYTLNIYLKCIKLPTRCQM